MADEERATIEDLLGTSFVVCQTYLTAVRARVQILHRQHDGQHPGSPLTTTSGKKADILKFGSAKIRGSGYCAVEAIEAFANYFKHNEEWSGRDWTSPSGFAARTIPVIKALGAERGDQQNLRRAAERLGDKKYRDVEVFAMIVERWQKRLVDGYARELRKRGLIERRRR